MDVKMGREEMEAGNHFADPLSTGTAPGTARQDVPTQGRPERGWGGWRRGDPAPQSQLRAAPLALGCLPSSGLSCTLLHLRVDRKVTPSSVGVTPGSALRNHSWQCSGGPYKVLKIEPRSALCKMFLRAAWSLTLRGLRIRGLHNPGATNAAQSKEKMPPYTDFHAQRSYPMPNEPFCTELNAEQQALKEKEKGSWTQLSHAEKVALYRLQYQETFAEMNRRSNEWKTVTGGLFFFIGLTALLIWWQRVYVFPEKPITLTDEWKAQQLQRVLDMKGNPVQGLASRWDYVKKEWKK